MKKLTLQALISGLLGWLIAGAVPNSHAALARAVERISNDSSFSRLGDQAAGGSNIEAFFATQQGVAEAVFDHFRDIGSAVGNLKEAAARLEERLPSGNIALQSEGYQRALAAQALGYSVSYERAGGASGPRSSYAVRPYLEKNAPDDIRGTLKAAFDTKRPESARLSFVSLLRASSRLTGLHSNQLRQVLDALFLGEMGRAEADTVSLGAVNGHNFLKAVVPASVYKRLDAVVPIMYQLPLQRGSRAWEHATHAQSRGVENQTDYIANQIAVQLADESDAANRLFRQILTDPATHAAAWAYLRDPRNAGEGIDLLGRLVKLGKLKRFAFDLTRTDRSWFAELGSKIRAKFNP